MTKFKLLFKLRRSYRNSIKCIKLIKNFLMDKPNECGSDANTTGTKKKIKVRKVKSQHKVSDLGYSSSDEGFIPLAARDSKWVDLAFYNPNFGNQQEDEDMDEEELQTVDVDGVMKPPILILFPGLSDKESVTLTSNLGSTGSTSDITKLLVGQKADFSRMRSSKKLFSNDTKLSSVQELVQEEQESATSSLNSYRLVTTASNKSVTERHESQESIPDYSNRKIKIKRRRRMPEATIDVDCGSSSSLIKVLRRRPPSRPRHRGNATLVRKDSELKTKSSNGSLGDDENENS